MKRRLCSVAFINHTFTRISGLNVSIVNGLALEKVIVILLANALQVSFYEIVFHLVCSVNTSVFRPQPKSWGPIELGCPSVCPSVIAFLYGLELLNGRS